MNDKTQTPTEPMESKTDSNSERAGVAEAKELIAQLLNHAPHPCCEEMHHAKKDQHEWDKPCPVVERAMKLRLRAEAFISANDSSPSSCSPLVRELMATIEYMRVACEHAEGATPDDQERLAMAMRVGIRMNAKHAGQVADYQMPSFWDDVRGIPASLSLANVAITDSYRQSDSTFNPSQRAAVPWINC